MNNDNIKPIKNKMRRKRTSQSTARIEYSIHTAVPPSKVDRKIIFIGEIARHYITHLRNCLKDNRCRKEVAFNLTYEQLNELFIKQNRKCALTGLDIWFDSYSSFNTTASLDRLDSTKPYEVGNVQWVHKLVNQIKMDLKNEEFLDLCQIVAKYQDSKKQQSVSQ